MAASPRAFAPARFTDLSHMCKSTMAGAMLAALATATLSAQTPRALADAVQRKLQAVMSAAPRTPAAPTPPRRTVFTEADMNAYLTHYAQSWLPPGITNAALRFPGPNKVTTLVTADLDGVRKKGSGGWFDPTSYLSGKLPVYVTGTLTTGDRKGRFLLESATVDGIPVPKLFIDELLAFYTRSAAHPAGVRMEEPFDLPSEIERIEVAPGLATVIQ